MASLAGPIGGVTAAGQLSAGARPQGQGQAGQSTGSGYQLSVNPSQPTDIEHPGFAENMAIDVYESIDKIGVELKPLVNRSETIVEQKLDGLVPDKSPISPRVEKPDYNGHQGIAALSKAFDHAIFMGLVTQVIGSVSNTARTLIRQT